MPRMKCSKTKGSAEVRGSRGSFSLGFCTPYVFATRKTLRSATCFCTFAGVVPTNPHAQWRSAGMVPTKTHAQWRSAGMVPTNPHV